MTQKQKDYIEFIEEFSCVHFKGNPNNQSNISDYINKNAPIAILKSSDNWALMNGY